LSPDTPEAAALAHIDRAIATLRIARRIIVASERSAKSSRWSPTDAPEDDFRNTGMTVGQAAAVLGVSEEHVRRLLRARKLRGVPYGGRIGWRLEPEYVTELARQLAAAGDAGTPRKLAGPAKRPGPKPKVHRGKRKR
jgi:excisionase family DNA binding protein